ncbi:hypothetical protein BO79DRAFT_4452 [Aspergillus costaricaensis CBS 115574]|uniref:Uncharacterized protein n=1 Tax=Aspergillus costaricaensis CBS 115574 TaxID=1448317 RepID=A0ACD1IW02_9EURO|nr:hypothetical protein BO79DRAFT_4452 [Aspergillus costaricaensis CBS 115574]RAK94641.1 hypothetical protein BO79DRAFT_4452 [Aspergillus costaricaensis CBS 115574]
MLLRDLGDEVNFIAKGINYYLGVIKFFNHWRGVCKQGSAMATYRKSELLATVESSGMNAQTCLVFNMLAMRLNEGMYGVKKQCRSEDIRICKKLNIMRQCCIRTPARAHRHWVNRKLPHHVRRRGK